MTAASPPAAAGGPAQRYSRAQCAALFEAIEHDDDIDLAATLPPPAPLAVTATLLRACYDLSWQLWRDDTRHADLLHVANRALCHGTLDAAAQADFKHQRARFKNLRFAGALFGAEHRYRPAFDHLTAALGGLQDAVKNARRTATRAHALWLRLLLTRPLYAWSTHALEGRGDTTPASFQAYLTGEMRALAAALAQAQTTRREFHALRKIISRQAALYCALEVLAPSPERTQLLRYHATLNGLMGNLHDELVAGRGPAGDAAGRFALPAVIRTRLAALVQFAAAATHATT